MDKRYVGGALLITVGVIMVPVSFSFHEKAWLVNSLPALIWGFVMLLGQFRFAALADPKPVLLGFVYGGLVGVWGISMLGLMVGGRTHPYDNGAYAIIQLLAAVLFLVILLVDYNKNGEERIWVRVLTALVTVLPSVLVTWPIMGYFEEILSRFVS